MSISDERLKQYAEHPILAGNGDISAMARELQSLRAAAKVRATAAEAQLKAARDAINRIADFDSDGPRAPDTVRLIRIAGAARRAALNPKAPS